MKIFAKILILITVFFFGYYYGQLTTKNLVQDNNPIENKIQKDQGNLEENKKTVSLMIDFHNGELSVFNDIGLTEGSSVFDLLKTTLEREEIDFKYKDYGGEMGALLESINGVENNMEDGKYWQYWFNNEYAKVGASMQELKSGDVIEWKYIKGQF